MKGVGLRSLKIERVSDIKRGDRLEVIGEGDAQWSAWERSPDAGCWWIVPAAGGGSARSVHWKSLRFAP